jgi:hypothetical protein
MCNASDWSLAKPKIRSIMQSHMQAKCWQEPNLTMPL